MYDDCCDCKEYGDDPTLEDLEKWAAGIEKTVAANKKQLSELKQAIKKAEKETPWVNTKITNL